MTRDVALRFHAKIGETFVIPEGKVRENTMNVPGTDGAKMSKSKDNIIDIFLPDKKLRKQIMGIQTDSTPLEEPKDPDTCTIFSLYELLANEVQIAEMRKNFLAGGYGYGHAKQALFDVIIDRFDVERTRYQYYMDNLNEVDKVLQIGAEKAKKVANDVLRRVRDKVGY
jgi:tryptophanyl-tRNA synthetase